MSAEERALASGALEPLLQVAGVGDLRRGHRAASASPVSARGSGVEPEEKVAASMRGAR